MLKKIFIIISISLLLSLNISFFNDFLLNIKPDTIITNNNIVNYYDIINNTSNNINNDSLYYSFKNEEIKKNIENFKSSFINTLNTFISNNNYYEAKKYLNKYIYLFSDDTQVISIQNYLENITSQNNLAAYTGDIEILCFSPLITYPKQILNENNPTALKTDENNITINEFEKILINLYERNYVLISPQLINEMSINKSIKLPHTKKPLILALEKVDYNTKANGCVDKLIIDNNDKIATYTPKRSINERICHNNDFITILENFIDNHPTFSFNNAKALIIVDGSNGIFGYNTQKSNATSKYEIKKAIEIINYLKNNGYYFASAGYNTSIKDSSVSFASGLNSWENDIVPIIGKTQFFYLNENIYSIEDDISYQADLLNAYEYSIIIGKEMINRLEFNEKLNNTYITAKKIDGKALRYSANSLAHLFDCEKIYDHINRYTTYNI